MSKYLVIKEFLVDGPMDASHLLVLAHGAGVGMASPFMERIAKGIAAQGLRVARFHFPYMEEMVRTGRKRPPDGGRILRACFAEVISHCVERERCPRERLVIGGKSMGGRIASMIADAEAVAGVVSLGYPFHPPSKPGLLRIDHLEHLRTPMLICQGERDPFGRRSEVMHYPLARSVRVHWLPDGNHSFAPLKTSGVTEEQIFGEAVAVTAEFIRGL